MYKMYTVQATYNTGWQTSKAAISIYIYIYIYTAKSILAEETSLTRKMVSFEEL